MNSPPPPHGVVDLPGELLLEIWDRLPALERVCVSQVCRTWRTAAIFSPRLWSCVALVSNWHVNPCSCDSRRPANTVYRPKYKRSNVNLAIELFSRSGQLPLDLSIHLHGCSRVCVHPLHEFTSALHLHSGRIARLHFSHGDSRALSIIMLHCDGELPSLRSITVGSDVRDLDDCDLSGPLGLETGRGLSHLTQMHMGALTDHEFFHWRIYPVPNLQVFTLTPSQIAEAIEPLLCCPNLLRFTIVVTHLFPPFWPRHVSRVLGLLARVPELWVSRIGEAQEHFVSAWFDDARYRNLTLDYVGLECRRDSPSYASLPSPCDALTESVRLTLTRLRRTVYKISVIDATECQRNFLVDYRPRRMAAALWDCYLRNKRVESAVVDATAWKFFAVGLPAECTIPELTLVVQRTPNELLSVTLKRFSGLRKLRIDVLRQGLRFESALILRLVQSRARKALAQLLPILSLKSNTIIGAETASILSTVCHVLEY